MSLEKNDFFKGITHKPISNYQLQCYGHNTIPYMHVFEGEHANLTYKGPGLRFETRTFMLHLRFCVNLSN